MSGLATAPEMRVPTEKFLRSLQCMEIIPRELLARSTRVGGLRIWPPMVPKRGHLGWKSVGCLESPPKYDKHSVWRLACAREDNDSNKTP